MKTTVFHSDLNEFCQQFLVTNAQNQNLSPSQFMQEEKRVSSTIFEQLLLFDAVAFKVHGENIPLALLLNKFGIKGIEALLEQEALRFVLWNQMVSHIVQDIPGIEPLQFGTLSSKPHSDPEESISLGFNWMTRPPKRSEKRMLLRKLRDIYSVPKEGLSAQAVSIVKSAYNSGKLGPYHLGPEQCEFSKLDLSNRKKLTACADEILQYSFLINENMSSYSNFEFYQLFNNTNEKLHLALDLQENFKKIAEIENVPDLPSLYLSLSNPFENLIKVRHKGSAKKFRKWLAECTEPVESNSVTREYVDAIANASGFFETKSGKFTKSIAMSAIGAGVGALIAGPVGALSGAGVAKILEPAADLGLDLLDEFVLSGLTRGWTPRMFFDDIEKIRRLDKKNAANG